MYVARKRIQDFWLNPKDCALDGLIGLYGVEKDKEPELFDKIDSIVRKDKKRFVKGFAITTADTDKSIEREIERFRKS